MVLLALFLFPLILVTSSLFINCWQWTLLALFAVPLLFNRHEMYHRCIRSTLSAFTLLMVVLTGVFAPCELVVTGDYHLLSTPTPSFAHSHVVIANHQIYTDWWFIWLLLWWNSQHQHIRIVLKKELLAVPVFGWGMRFFQFIFLDRKWRKDQQTLSRSLLQASRCDLPLFLVLFPEGTVITSDTHERSRQYASKSLMRPSVMTKHVLIPKSTGLLHCLQSIRSSFNQYLFDLTICYDCDPSQFPYDVLSPYDTFIRCIGPRRIYIHVNAIPIDTIPGIDAPDTPAFEQWLRDLYVEKDQRMHSFLSNGASTADSQSIRFDWNKLDFTHSLAYIIQKLTNVY